MQALTHRKQRKMAEQWRQQQLLLACVQGWECHTAYKAEQELFRRRAVRHRQDSIHPCRLLNVDICRHEIDYAICSDEAWLVQTQLVWLHFRV